MIPYIPKSKGPKIVELNNNDVRTPSSIMKHSSEQSKRRGRSSRFADENNPNLSVSFDDRRISRSMASTPATKTSASRGKNSLPNSAKTKTPARGPVTSTKTPAKKSLNTSKTVSTPSTIDVFRQLSIASGRKPFAELNTPVRRSPRLSRMQVL